jgi:hypothetical protein
MQGPRSWKSAGGGLVRGRVYGLDNRFVLLCIQFKGFCAITS